MDPKVCTECKRKLSIYKKDCIGTFVVNVGEREVQLYKHVECPAEQSPHAEDSACEVKNKQSVVKSLQARAKYAVAEFIEYTNKFEILANL